MVRLKATDVLGRHMTAGPNRLVVAIALCAASLLFVSDTPSAMAASRVCRQLEAELAGVGSAPSGKSSKAIQRQRDQLAKARARASDAGCGGFSLFAGGTCRALNGAVKRLERNLATLERKQGQGGSG